MREGEVSARFVCYKQIRIRCHLSGGGKERTRKMAPAERTKISNRKIKLMNMLRTATDTGRSSERQRRASYQPGPPAQVHDHIETIRAKGPCHATSSCIRLNRSISISHRSLVARVIHRRQKPARTWLPRSGN
jgi:hypothetical protein